MHPCENSTAVVSLLSRPLIQREGCIQNALKPHYERHSRKQGNMSVVTKVSCTWCYQHGEHGENQPNCFRSDVSYHWVPLVTVSLVTRFYCTTVFSLNELIFGNLLSSVPFTKHIFLTEAIQEILKNSSKFLLQWRSIGRSDVGNMCDRWRHSNHCGDCTLASKWYD